MKYFYTGLGFFFLAVGIIGYCCAVFADYAVFYYYRLLFLPKVPSEYIGGLSDLRSIKSI